jgi:hypothetical protein
VKLAAERLEVPADPRAFAAFVAEQRLGDGLPLVPPTEATVADFLRAAGMDPAEPIGEIPPLMGPATVETAAINAVMAGCRPEYLSVVLAGVRAALAPEFNLFGIQATTNPVAPLFIVNGPVRTQIGMNTGYGSFGPGNRANATIGRAIRLLFVNAGGAVPGEGDMSGLGWVGKYTLCLPEHEEDSPWEPLHIARGLPAGSSAVTVVGVTGDINVRGPNRAGLLPPHRILVHELAEALAYTGNNDYTFGGTPVIVLNPAHAEIAARAGMSRRDFQQAVFDAARIPVERFPIPEFREGRTDVPRDAPEGVPPAERPEDICIVVAGARAAGDHSQVLPSWGQTRAATAEVRTS